MNTGIQRSGATMHAAWTTTSPAGKVIPGKPEWKKPMARIIAAHGLEYVATASPAYPLDLIRKVKRGMAVDGPAFLHVISPCMRGWRFDASLAIELARLAVTTRFFPLYEVEWGYKYTLNRPSPKKEKVPIEEYLSKQGRFAHLFKPEKREGIINAIQKHLDEQWEVLLDLCHIEA